MDAQFFAVATLKWRAEIEQWMLIFSVRRPLKWGAEFTQWMCNFARAATLKWGTEIEQWMFNFSPVEGLEMRQDLQSNCIILRLVRRWD